jgi:Flp pilus assembly protein CpaB
MFIPVGRDEAVSARLERGDVVDVYFFTDELALGGEARLLLSRLRVVEVCEQAGLRGASSELLGVITEVTPAQAAVLVYALESGEVYLALAAHNATPVEVQPVTRSRLLLEADGHTREKQQLPGVIP